jgi:tetratricopeptide (TPR) repeat protein
MACHSLKRLLLALTLASHSQSAWAQTPGSLAVEGSPALPTLRRGYADETPEGKAALASIQQSISATYAQRDGIVSQRAPLVDQRGVLQGSIDAQVKDNLVLNQQYLALKKSVDGINKSLKKANGTEASTLSLQLGNLNLQIKGVRDTFNQNSAAINQATVQRDALDRQIAPFNARLVAAWKDLEAARRRWREAYSLDEKYARGDEVQLQTGLETQLVTDTQWPDGWFWVALCAYEQGKYEEAEKAVERGAEIFNALSLELGNVKPSSRLKAMGALIGLKQKGKTAKAADDMKAAIRLATSEKENGDWATFYLAGRAALDKTTTISQAKGRFLQALELEETRCTKLWMARMQTLAPTAAAGRDAKSAVATLENCWKHSSEQGWRPGYFLVEAYLADGRRNDADALWQRLAGQIPPARLSELTKSYEAAVAGALP